MKDFQPLSNEEKTYIEKLTVAYKQGDSLDCIDFDQYKDIKPHGISLASLLETYNSCMIQA
jgi:predicted aldo/keto reductase-like oxidoreductase